MTCTKGFNRLEFDHLGERDKKRLLKLIAQVSETAYRRGAQQGASFALIGLIANADKMGDWRYDIPLSRRPFMDQMASIPWQNNEEFGICQDLFGVFIDCEWVMKPVAKNKYKFLTECY